MEMSIGNLDYWRKHRALEFFSQWKCIKWVICTVYSLHVKSLEVNRRDEKPDREFFPRAKSTVCMYKGQVFA